VLAHAFGFISLHYLTKASLSIHKLGLYPKQTREKDKSRVEVVKDLPAMDNSKLNTNTKIQNGIESGACQQSAENRKVDMINPFLSCGNSNSHEQFHGNNTEIKPYQPTPQLSDLSSTLLPSIDIVS